MRRVVSEETDVINHDGPSLMGIWGVGNKYGCMSEIEIEVGKRHIERLTRHPEACKK